MASGGAGQGTGTVYKPPPLVQGEVDVDEFEQVAVLGTGKSCTVWLARRNGDYYALKVIPKAKVVGQSQLRHLFTERDLLRAVKCPYTLTLYTTMKDATNLYFVTDVAGGGDLISHIRRAPHGRLSHSTARTYAAEVVVALAAVHAQGAVYRDLKANNVVLDGAGRTKLIDFGLSKVVDTDELCGRTDTYCGTPHAMAPEIVLRKGHGKPVDWWALGVLVYEMLVGTPPFGTSARPVAVPPGSKRGSDGGTATAAAAATGAAGAGAGAGAGASAVAVADSGESGANKKRGGDGETGAAPEPSLSALDAAIVGGVDVVAWPADVFGSDTDGAAQAQAFIRACLTTDEASRLGANGASEVMKHPWFSAVEWDAVAQGRHPVPAWDRSLGEWLGPDDVLDPAVDADVFGDF